MIRAVFENRITGSNSSGNQSWTTGPQAVYVDLIPEGAPQDWAMGPKMRPGEYGVFFEHLHYPERHGPYAAATGKHESLAQSAAAGLFRTVTGPDGKQHAQQPRWEEL